MTQAVIRGVGLAAAMLLLAAPVALAGGRSFCERGEVTVEEALYSVRLRVEQSSLTTGELALARVENHGTELIQFGRAYAVQRFSDGSWEEAPGSPDGPWFMDLQSLRSGISSACMRYRVPADATPGWYRFVKTTTSVSGRDTARSLRAPFRVTG